MKQTRDFLTEFKAAGSNGSFEGYASVFENVDDGYDVMERGAFQEFAKKRDGKTIIIVSNNMREPIGKDDV